MQVRFPGEAALLNERNAICIEINEEYFEKGKRKASVCKEQEPVRREDM